MSRSVRDELKAIVSKIVDSWVSIYSIRAISSCNVALELVDAIMLDFDDLKNTWTSRGADPHIKIFNGVHTILSSFRHHQLTITTRVDGGRLPLRTTDR